MSDTVWLVDVGYVVKASEGRFPLDYLAAERFLTETLGPTRSYLFNGYDPDYGIPSGLEAFYQTMERQGIQVRLHPMDPGPRGANRQRRVDVDFAAHLVWQASRAEVKSLVITTGDQDFVPAVEVARAHLEKQVILFTYDQYVHRDLRDAVSERWLFEDLEPQVRRDW